jgi:methionine-R-sulfoxide reductase
MNDRNVVPNGCSIKYRTREKDAMSEPTLSDDQLREKLTPEQYHVTQEAGTERAFTGIYWDEHDDGVYRCVVCDAPLFSSSTKFDSGTGWPSFYEALENDAIILETDRSLFTTRTEAKCARCDAHLGHVFDDGPAPTGQRFCMNSASLRLDRDAAIDEDDDEAAEA